MNDAGTALTDRLLDRIGQGDEDAMAAFYRQHGRVVFAQILLMTGERALAEEVTQDAMLAVWRGAGSFRGESSERSWVISIARRQARDRLRGRRLAMADESVLAEQPSPGPGPEITALDRAELAEVIDAIGELGPTHREVLGLAFGCGQRAAGQRSGPPRVLRALPGRGEAVAARSRRDPSRTAGDQAAPPGPRRQPGGRARRHRRDRDRRVRAAQLPRQRDEGSRRRTPLRQDDHRPAREHPAGPGRRKGTGGSAQGLRRRTRKGDQPQAHWLHARHRQGQPRHRRRKLSAQAVLQLSRSPVNLVVRGCSPASINSAITTALVTR